ncbi:hypothetical protein HQ393_03430 [Chitinibacter bivalviorum]|uniref:Uncharacterized protein n=1 Tax=Chitinibacter bivalviorum TaxID=2739434 RepID=A0A7H9BFA3_9NEIS|nr:hypothetical protein [Chitinibacter bivalviorum]QLG87383.1 hypothetical protein HQ393_03430 [Chitinibacter bivalviorum]
MNLTIRDYMAFFTAFAVMFIYYLIWYLFRYMSWPWHNSYNIPGFFLLLLSWPWSEVLFSAQSYFEGLNIFGKYSSQILLNLLTSIGFGLNVVIVRKVFVGVKLMLK